ncbi:hypothetical protein AAHK20_04345 [Trinickia sp. YCB016]
MRYLRLAMQLLAISASAAHAQIDSERSFVVTLGKDALEFRCDDTADLPHVIVSRSASIGVYPLLTYQLDDVDDCGQATWLLEKFDSDSSSALVMLNPGRMGLNAQLTTFLIRGGTVSFAGNILIRADRISDTDYRSYSADADSYWERTDSLVGDKFATVRELRLMRAGSICTDKFGAVAWKEQCAAKRIFASQRKPICIEYRKQQGEIVALNTCANLRRSIESGS